VLLHALGAEPDQPPSHALCVGDGTAWRAIYDARWHVPRQAACSVRSSGDHSGGSSLIDSASFTSKRLMDEHSLVRCLRTRGQLPPHVLPPREPIDGGLSSKLRSDSDGSETSELNDAWDACREMEVVEDESPSCELRAAVARSSSANRSHTAGTSRLRCAPALLGAV